MEHISFEQFYSIGLLSLEVIILWCMIDISNTLKSQNKEIREWTK